MAHYQNKYGATGQGTTDEYGNPINPTRRTDEFGNQVEHHTTGTTPHGIGAGQGTHGTTTDPTGYGGTGYGAHGGGQGVVGHQPEPHGVTGVLHRSGSSSSSSEDDGEGGRRKKKSVKDKIKEKLPGGHKEEQYGSHAAPGGGTMGEHHEKAAPHCGTTGEHQEKGMIGKIKEKLPGGHKDEQHGGHPTATTTPYGGTTATTGTGHAYGDTEPHEKKGVMDKIKDKLPGGGNR